MKRKQSIRYAYTDFVTGKVRYTYGDFVGWTDETGPLHTRYAIFTNRSSTILVPRYCLTAETRSKIGKPPQS